jgi:hypothetical protein
MLRRCIAFLSILAFAHLAEQSRAATNWKSVLHQDLKLTAADIGDPQADAAILFREGELNDNDAEGTSLKVYIRIKIFNDRGRKYADVQLPYRADLGKITDVRARTVRPDGTQVTVEGRDILDRLISKTSHGVYRAKVFSMPAVEAGSIIEYRYRQTYPQGFRYFALDLQSELFTKKLFYSIQPHAGSRLDVRWVTFNASDSKLFAPTWDGTYNIQAENIPPFKREPLMPPDLTVKTWGWLYYSDELETNPEKYWRSYSQRMNERARYETKPSSTIRRVVDAITLSTDSPKDKITRIYNYVQNEIQNIGTRETVASAEDSPESAFKKNDSADQTIKRRYGTPREINRLFISMLRAADFDARVAELTTRDENFFHLSFPDAFQFNGEVAAVIAKDKSIQFFDPGTPYCPPGMLSWEKESVTALVYDESDLRFVTTPLADAARNGEERRLSVNPSADGSAEVRAEVKVTGQRAIEFRNELVDLTPDDRRKRIANPIRAILPAATINESTVALSNLTDAAAPTGATYNFTVPQFASKAGSRLLMRPALLSHRDESLLTSSGRSNSVYLRYPWSESEQVVINLPAGYEVEQLPDPIDIDIGAARYQASFIQAEGRVIYERRLVVDAITFKVDQYDTVKAFFDRVHQADRAVISFKQ